MMRAAVREAAASIILRSITGLSEFTRLLDEAGWRSLATTLRQRQAGRPAITGIPKDPEAWKQGSLKFLSGPNRKTDGGFA